MRRGSRFTGSGRDQQMSVAVAHVVLLFAVANDPSSEIVARAAANSLATPFTASPAVVLRLVPQPPAHSRVDALTRETKADAVIFLTCARAGCASASLRANGAGEQPTSQKLRFAPRDDLAQRGRAIGLLASTLLPAGWSRIGSAPDSAKNTEPGAPPPVALVPDIDANAVPASAPPWAFETAAAVFAGTSGGLSDFGLTLAAERVLAGRWAARIALKLELGETPEDTGTLRGVGAALGVMWTSPSLARPRHFGVGARADAVAMGRQVRLNTTETNEQSSLSLGADAVGLVGYSLSPSATLLGGLGAEILAGGPSVSDDDDPMPRRRASPSRFRIVAEIGLLARF
jgi:hypothetical protein